MRKNKKKKRYYIAISFALAFTFFAFMGLEKFEPESRTINIVDNNAIATSNSMVLNDNELNIKAKSAILIDGEGNNILYSQNEKKHLPPASVTKVMTILLVLEACDENRISLNDMVTISDDSAQMGGSQMYMEPGEKHKVEELLKGIIMVSANDACVALAEYVSGSVDGFVDDMNKRAREMGLKDSNFVNTNGLPDNDHYSCAYDIAMISSELMKHNEARKWFTLWQEEIKVGLPGKESAFVLTNTNKLLKQYNGTIGVKTGYTDDAGYCLSAAARRNDSTMIAVVLGCKSSDIRFNEAKRLLDYGFANFEAVKVLEKGDTVKTIEIAKGDERTLDIEVAENVYITVKKGSKKNIDENIKLHENIELPIKKGDELGVINITVNGKEYGTYNVYAASDDINRAGIITTLKRSLEVFTN